MGWACERIPRLPPIHVTGDVRGLLEFPPDFLRSDLMLVTGLRPEKQLNVASPNGKSLLISLIQSYQPITSTLVQGTFPIVGQLAAGPTPSIQVGMAQHLRLSFATCSGFRTSRRCLPSCINFVDRLWCVIAPTLSFAIVMSLQR